MEGKDRVGERTFRVQFSEDGAAQLAERLTDRLKEYMGDFVDDTLVKYVIVLLGNGRRKEEVKEDLDVFLGDESDSFVTWLWDHLASNLDQYVQSLESCAEEVAKAETELVQHTGKVDYYHPLSESERGKSTTKSSRSRHNRDWKELVTDLQNEEKAYCSALCGRQSVSSETLVHRKRSRPDERPRLKRASQATIAAPRRLLQFAVREAVATTRPFNSVSEPARKRLCSVVSTSTNNSLVEVHPQRIQSAVSLQNPMRTAIKAVAEAAEDVKRVRTRNVFDRLSHGAGGSSDQVSAFREPTVQDDEYDDYDQIYEKAHRRYLRARNCSGQYNANASSTHSSSNVATDSASDNEGYDNVNVVGCRVMDVSETGRANGKIADGSLMVQQSVAQSTDEMTCQSQKKDQEEPVSVANTKHKIVNISVNVSTWKPPHYKPAREMVEVETRKSRLETEVGASNSNLQVMKENSNPVTVLGNGKAAADRQRENQSSAPVPGSYATGPPLEDADSRTIFVTNVHFAATKDTLSRHFNKFGEVLKAIILIDAATGHPKGSAYVEFMRKDAAENALTLDGTSFMSRIIKVVKKSSAQQEACPMMSWPRITRGSPFTVPRFAQASFPRVFPGTYRARPSVGLGARSMQWKRDAQQSSAESMTSFSGNITNPPSAGRGLTYIRTGSKSDGNTGVA